LVGPSARLSGCWSGVYLVLLLNESTRLIYQPDRMEWERMQMHFGRFA
jgi:hypothetical protein